MKDPLMSRLIRVESKLTKLMLWMDMQPPQVYVTGSQKNIPTSEHDIGRALVRIETKLHALMKQEGLDPFARDTCQRKP
jgi:hypothetical protein